MYYVYVLKSDKDGSLYIGSAKNVEARVECHNKGFNKSTKGKLPWHLEKIEEYPSVSLAVKREKFLKSGDGRKVLRILFKKF